MAAKKIGQSERFIAKAKELGASEDAEEFERAFKKVVPPKRGSSKADVVPPHVERLKTNSDD